MVSAGSSHSPPSRRAGGGGCQPCELYSAVSGASDEASPASKLPRWWSNAGRPLVGIGCAFIWTAPRRGRNLQAASRWRRVQEVDGVTCAVPSISSRDHAKTSPALALCYLHTSPLAGTTRPLTNSKTQNCHSHNHSTDQDSTQTSTQNKNGMDGREKRAANT